MREDIQTAPKQQENLQNARKPRGTRGQRSDPVWPAPETTRPTPIKKEPPWLMASQSPFKTAKNCPKTLEQFFLGCSLLRLPPKIRRLGTDIREGFFPPSRQGGKVPKIKDTFAKNKAKNTKIPSRGCSRPMSVLSLCSLVIFSGSHARSWVVQGGNAQNPPKRPKTRDQRRKQHGCRRK